MHGQTLAGCGLATRRRTGDEYQFDAFAVGYLVGNTRNLLLLQGLTNLDEVRAEALVDTFVQVANGAHAQDVLPAVVLLEDAKHLVLHHNLAQLVGVLARRDAQQQSVIVFLQSEEIDLFRIGEDGTIEIVVVFADVVEGGVERTGALQEFYL